MTTPGWRAGWRTSTRSSNGSDCVEVDFTATGVEMRDSKAHGTGPIIDFTPNQWAAFLDDLSGGGGATTVNSPPRRSGPVQRWWSDPALQADRVGRLRRWGSGRRVRLPGAGGRSDWLSQR